MVCLEIKKPLLIIGRVVFSVSFFGYCQSVPIAEGSLARQVDLMEDLENKLPEEDRPRYRKFLENVRIEERLKDNQFIEEKDDRKEAEKTAQIQSVDAGKWKGIRNLAISLGVATLLFFGWKILRSVKPISI